jgi:glutathione S-transferase
MALKLFEHPLSPYAQKVKIALYEKGIPFERIFIDPNVRGQDPAHQEFVLASPRYEVPALVNGQTRLADSTIIIEYLDERFPKPLFGPATPEECVRVRVLEEMMDTEYDAVNWGISEVKVFDRTMDDEQADRLLTRAGLQLQRLWNRLERELEGRHWMNGEYFGRGDAAVYPQLSTSQALGYTVTDLHPKLLEWEQRVAGRSAIKRVQSECATAMRDQRQESASGEMKVVRQYRDHRLEWMMKTGGSDIVMAGLLDGTIRYSDEYE